MSIQMEQADQDEDWLYRKLEGRKYKPSTAQVDAFCDRVWDLISTRGTPVNDARSTALSEVFGRK